MVNAGQNPVWDEDFKISNVEEEDSIFFECYVILPDGHQFVGGSEPFLILDSEDTETHVLKLIDRAGDDAGSLTVRFEITDPSRIYVPVDWRKCVSMVPPHVMKFQVLKEDVENPKIPRLEVKGTAFV